MAKYMVADTHIQSKLCNKKVGVLGFWKRSSLGSELAFASPLPLCFIH